METNLVQLTLTLLGANLWLTAEPLAGGARGFSMENVRAPRFDTESAVLRALAAAGVGSWSSFPLDGIQATLSRAQLRSIGFKGNF